MLYKFFKNLIFKIIFRCKGRYLMKLGTDIYGLVFSMSFCILATVHRKRYFAPAAQEITLQNPLQRLVEEFYHYLFALTTSAVLSKYVNELISYSVCCKSGLYILWLDINEPMLSLSKMPPDLRDHIT